MENFFTVSPFHTENYLFLIIGFDKYYARMLQLEGEELGIRCIKTDSLSEILPLTAEYNSIIAAVNSDVITPSHNDGATFEFLYNNCQKTAFISTKKALGGAFSFISESPEKMRVFKKPFPITELLYFLFSSSDIVYKAPFEHTEKALQIGLSSNPHSASCNGAIIYFTPKEFQTLAFLISKHGVPSSREEIFASVWEKENTGANTVDVYIRHLRKKFEEYFDFPIIKTVREKGYAINRNIEWKL